MKNPIKYFRVIIIILVAFSIFKVSAQDVWSTNGNNADSTDFIGTKNAQPLLIKTDSIDRIIIGTNDSIQFKGTSVFDSIKISNGFIQSDSINARVVSANNIIGVNDTLRFKGTALFDSIKIPTGFMQVDSFRARVIHVGDSSMTIGSYSAGNPDEITSSSGVITFARTPRLSQEFPKGTLVTLDESRSFDLVARRANIN